MSEPAAAPGAPVGVFDSGLGGLTAVRELRRLLPGEDIVYFGDTGRVPYGTKGREIIIAYTRQVMAFLIGKGVKTVLAACGTVSSTFPPEESGSLPLGYLGVVQPAAAAAAAATRRGRIGVIGTEATVASGSYQQTLSGLFPGARVTVAACPLYVPLVENGHFAPGDAMARLATEEYLAPLKAAEVDTLILGCTHYPLLEGIIAAHMGPHVALVDAGREAARALRDGLAAQKLLNPREAGGTLRTYVSDAPARFDQLAALFLGGGEGAAEVVNLEEAVNIEKYDLKLLSKGYRRVE
jgi:glutamate racemase